MRDAAWQKHCRERGLDAADRTAKRAWHAQVLSDAAGVSSAADLDKAAGFEAAMAAYERICEDGYQWQLKHETGILRRLAYVTKRPDLTAAYVAGIAQQMFSVDATASLSVLTHYQVVAIRKALLVDRRRRL